MRPSVYIIQIMDLSDNTLMESNTTILGVPEVIELTVNEKSVRWTRNGYENVLQHVQMSKYNDDKGNWCSNGHMGQ